MSAALEELIANGRYKTRDQVCDWLQVTPRQLTKLMAEGHFPRASARRGHAVWPTIVLSRWLDTARDRSRVPIPVKTALYRHFNEAGELLYVGISLCAIGRAAQHRHTAEWYEQVAEMRVQWFPNREEALAAEAAAIKTECPIYNKAGIQ